MGGREKKKKEGGERWCAPAATATAVGHAWRAAAGGGARGRRGERKKEGRDSRRLVTTCRVGWERDETWIEFGCRVRSPGIGRSEQEGFREVRVRV